jgi:hypothetical protein
VGFLVLALRGDRLALSCWPQLTLTRRVRIKATLQRAVQLAEVDIDGEFVMSPTGHLDTVRAASGYQARTAEQVHPSEMELAVRHVVQDARGANRAEIIEAVSRAFGWNRTSAAIGAAITASIDRLIAAGALHENGAGLRIA